MICYRIFWGIDAIVVLTAIYFFIEGMLNQTVKSNNAGIWFLMLAIPVLVLLTGTVLKNNEHIQYAKTILGCMAVPAVLAGLFILYLTTQKWN
jgi:hypothetical protein